MQYLFDWSTGDTPRLAQTLAFARSRGNSVHHAIADRRRLADTDDADSILGQGVAVMIPVRAWKGFRRAGDDTAAHRARWSSIWHCTVGERLFNAQPDVRSVMGERVKAVCWSAARDTGGYAVLGLQDESTTEPCRAAARALPLRILSTAMLRRNWHCIIFGSNRRTGRLYCPAAEAACQRSANHRRSISRHDLADMQALANLTERREN